MFREKMTDLHPNAFLLSKDNYKVLSSLIMELVFLEHPYAKSESGTHYLESSTTMGLLIHSRGDCLTIRISESMWHVSNVMSNGSFSNGINITLFNNDWVDDNIKFQIPMRKLISDLYHWKDWKDEQRRQEYIKQQEDLRCRREALLGQTSNILETIFDPVVTILKT